MFCGVESLFLDSSGGRQTYLSFDKRIVSPQPVMTILAEITGNIFATRREDLFPRTSFSEIQVRLLLRGGGSQKSIPQACRAWPNHSAQQESFAGLYTWKSLRSSA